jgi:hypothetical protein
MHGIIRFLVMGLKKKHGRIQGSFASVKISLVLLGIFAVLLFAGWIYHQNFETNRLEHHPEEGQGLIRNIDTFGFLELIRANLFVFMALIFILHLVLCLIQRFRTILMRPSFRLFAREDLLQRDHSFSLSRSSGAGTLEIEEALRNLGFGKPEYYSEDARVKRVVCEKGFPFRWLSWLFHLFILLSLLGIVSQYRFDNEDYLLIATGERKTVVLEYPVKWWQDMFGLLNRRDRAEQRTIEVALDNFATELARGRVLPYPYTLGDMFVSVWKDGAEALKYHVGENLVYPRNWASRLKMYEDGELIGEGEIKINKPLRCRDLSFYQIGCEYRYDLRVGDEVLKGILAGKPFAISQMEGEFRLSTPFAGTFYRGDENITLSVPSAELQHRPPIGGVEPEWTRVEKLVLEKPTEVMHSEVTLADIREYSILSYKSENGMPFIWFVFPPMLALMFLRIFLPWYQVRCHIEDSMGHLLITISIRMIGLFARPERLKQRISETLIG